MHADSTRIRRVEFFLAEANTANGHESVHFTDPAEASTVKNQSLATIHVRLLPMVVLFDAFPCSFRGSVELVLNLLDAVSARYQHSGDDEGVRFLPRLFEFFACLLAKDCVPRFTRLVIGPVKVLRGP